MFSLQWEFEMIARLFLAVILGAVIGIERELVNKSAGFRTHVLVAVGSCLMMIISISMPFIQFPGQLTRISVGDPGRIAAQVVSGIGFLGAGAIMHSGISIKGLTTAASLWAMAGIGLAVGAGLYTTAVAGTILIYISLTYFVKLEDSSKLHRQLVTILIYSKNGSEPMCAIFSIFNNMGITIKNTKLVSDENSDDKNVKIELLGKMTIKIDLQELTDQLNSLPDIEKVEIV